MISEILEKLFPRNSSTTSSAEAKRRLKLVIAHDRVQLSPGMMELMRKDILEVVSHYLEIDSQEMELCLENEEDITVLTANLPIRRVKQKGSLTTPTLTKKQD